MKRVLASLLVLSALSCFAGVLHAADHARALTPHEFGRLFLQPSQRAVTLSPARRTAATDPSTEPVADAQADERAARFHLNGVVIDGSGRMSLWVNGARYASAGTMSIVALEAPGRIRVTLTDHATPVELGVGQWLDLTSQRIVEGFEIRAPDPAAEAQPVSAAIATNQSPRAKRPSTRAPALHLHVHTAKPRPRRKSAGREDD